MTKKSKKLKEPSRTVVNKRNGIRFGSDYFLLGKVKIVLCGLDKELRNLIIQLYKAGRLDRLLSKKQRLKDERVVELDEFLGRHLVRTVIQLEKFNFFDRKCRALSKISLTQTSYGRKDMNFQQGLQQMNSSKNLLSKKTKENEQKVKIVLCRRILKLEKELFCESILLIIEQYEGMTSNQKPHLNPVVTVVFEQCYPQRQYFKSQLVEIIGLENYKARLRNTFNIYFRQSATKEFDTNPNLILCHQCDEIIANIDKQAISCSCLNSSEYIGSQIQSNPVQYEQKIIRKKFCSQTEFERCAFKHDFFRYFDKQSASLSNKLKKRHSKRGSDPRGDVLESAPHLNKRFKCSRFICSDCYIKSQQKLKRCSTFSQEAEAEKYYICRLCLGDCSCRRCLQMKKIVILTAHFLNYGGSLQELEQKFCFRFADEPNSNLLFQNCKKVTLRNPLSTKFLYEATLKKMVNYYKANFEEQFKLLIKTSNWKSEDYEPRSSNKIISEDKPEIEMGYLSKNLHCPGPKRARKQISSSNHRSRVHSLEGEDQVMSWRGALPTNKLLIKNTHTSSSNRVFSNLKKLQLTENQLKQHYDKDASELIKKFKNQGIFIDKLPKENTKFLIRPEKNPRALKLLDLKITFKGPFGSDLNSNVLAEEEPATKNKRNETIQEEPQERPSKKDSTQKDHGYGSLFG